MVALVLREPQRAGDRGRPSTPTAATRGAARAACRSRSTCSPARRPPRAAGPRCGGARPRAGRRPSGRSASRRRRRKSASPSRSMTHASIGRRDGAYPGTACPWIDPPLVGRRGGTVATVVRMLALITGANRGIGRSTALQLARDGVDIILTYRTHADEAAEVVAEIEALGRTARALQLDTGDVASFPAFVAALGDTRIDYLVNNAGMSIGGAFGEVTGGRLRPPRRRPLQGRLLPHPGAAGPAGRRRRDRQPLDRPDPLHRARSASSTARSRAPSRCSPATWPRNSGRAASPSTRSRPGAVATDFSGGLLRDNAAVREHIAVADRARPPRRRRRHRRRDRRPARRRQPLGHGPAHRGLRRAAPLGGSRERLGGAVAENDVPLLSVVASIRSKPTAGTAPNSRSLGLPAAHDQRVHPEPQLVEQAVLQQQPRHGPEAVLDDVLAGSLLEPRDLGGDVAARSRGCCSTRGP